MLRRFTPYPNTPRLETGDRLDQPTFHRLYESTPENFRAELIRGTVFVSPQTRWSHGKCRALVTGWLGLYFAATRGVDLAGNVTVLLPPDDEPEPVQS